MRATRYVQLAPCWQSLFDRMGLFSAFMPHQRVNQHVLILYVLCLTLHARCLRGTLTMITNSYDFMMLMCDPCTMSAGHRRLPGKSLHCSVSH